MEDKNENKPCEKIDGEVKISVPVSKKLENFWYHYKWHTIAIVFVILVAVVLTFSFCSREEYDVHILYAGDKAISTSKSNPERQQFLSAFGSVSKDYDENGSTNVAFKHLYAPDEEEIDRIEQEGGEIPDRLIYEDSKMLSTLLAQSEYYLLFLDKAVFDTCSKSGFISDVTPYLEGFGGEIVRGENGATGIFLADTGFYELEGIKLLPSDTVVCVKLANAWANDSDIELRNRAIEVFKKIAAS